MFCSAACKDELYLKAVNIDEVHDPEMKLLSDVFGYFGSANKFDNYLSRTDIKTLNKTIFDHDLSRPEEDPEYDDKIVNCLLSLWTDKNNFEQQKMQRSYLSGKSCRYLSSIYHLNKKALFSGDGRNNYFQTGFAIGLFQSLINHACIPNAQTIAVDNKLVTFIIKPIKAGEQLLVCYA